MMNRIVHSLLIVSLALSAGCNTFLDIFKDDQIASDPHKRTAGARLVDRTIRTVAQHNIEKSHPDLDKAHIEVHSYNGVTLITGEVPSKELHALATETAKKVANVRVVHNETVVRSNSSLMSRANDNYLHTKIKLSLSREEALDGTDIDVVVQDSVAYLMGLVNQEQAEVAAHTTSLTGGVRRVVKIFEYIEALPQ